MDLKYKVVSTVTCDYCLLHNFCEQNKSNIEEE